MKIILLLLTLVLSFNLYAEEVIDTDGDGFTCTLEDDGLYCGEDDQDKCDGIPNISLDDDHCSMDYNADGLFTLDDVRIIQSQKDHYLTGFPYPFYESLGLPSNFGGYACYDMLRAIEYNRRLEAAGLPPLQVNQLFAIAIAPPHCGTDHHSYPPIL